MSTGIHIMSLKKTMSYVRMLIVARFHVEENLALISEPMFTAFLILLAVTLNNSLPGLQGSAFAAKPL